MKLLVKLVFILFYIFGGLIFLTPFFVKNFVAECVARIWFYLVPIKKKILLLNLSFVFQRKAQESMEEYRERLEHLALRNMHHTFLCVLELFERFHWDDRTLQKKTVIEGNEFFQAQVRAGQGFFILTAHLGNWELITRVGAFLKIRLHIITKNLRNSLFNDLWVQSRKRYGLALLKEEGSGVQVLRSIEKGASVGFILDQHTGLPHGMKVKFFGVDAWSPKGLAILSSRMEVPVLWSFIKRLPDGRHFVKIGPPIDFSLLNAPQFRNAKGHLNEEGQKAHIEICNALIEKFVQECPEQYLWIHKRFKETRDYKQRLVWEL